MSQRLVVLGGCGGIGRAVCALALERGWMVSALDLPKTIERHPPPPPIAAHAVDAVDPASLARALDAAAGGAAVHGFVALAGFMTAAAPLAEGSSADWNEVIEGNLTATRHAAAVAAARIAPGGAMVLTGSGLGHVARPGYGPYAVAKAGVAAIGRQLALELAPAVRVNTVAPSAVDTAFLRGGAGRSDEDQPARLDIDAYAQGVPLRRIAQPRDVAGPILFLLSADAAYVTGQVLHVNGGIYAP